MPVEFKETTEETLATNSAFQEWFEENIEIDEAAVIYKEDMMEATHGLIFKDIKDALRGMGYKYDGKKTKTKDKIKKKGAWVGIRLVM